VTTPAHPSEADGRDMSHAIFVRPDLNSFCRLDELGLQVVGQRLEYEPVAESLPVSNN
jgi:hypothetical protein